jgi:hypothetical protein
MAAASIGRGVTGPTGGRGSVSAVLLPHSEHAANSAMATIAERSPEVSEFI